MARIAAESRIPIAWYRVTADDSSEAAVTAHLGTSMRSALGIQTAADTGMDSLLAVLEDQPDVEALVVIDDLHEIADTPAEAAIGRFIELRPTALRMLVGSRRQPGINIPRLRVSGLLREITSDDLRFRTWEVEELFTGFFREPLLPEAAAALTRRTGGWAAGLQLFHLATAGRSSAERAQAVTDLGGRSKLVRSYLARNVLDTIGEERRLFLLRTCTLGVLNAALCDELLETTGSARILDELEQRQLFTSSADDGQTFRYHEVLRTHLELALVEEGGAAGARSWYARAAALLERAGHLARGRAGLRRRRGLECGRPSGRTGPAAIRRNRREPAAARRRGAPRSLAGAGGCPAGGCGRAPWWPPTRHSPMRHRCWTNRPSGIVAPRNAPPPACGFPPPPAAATSGIRTTGPHRYASRFEAWMPRRHRQPSARRPGRCPKGWSRCCTVICGSPRRYCRRRVRPGRGIGRWRPAPNLHPRSPI